MFAGFHFIFDKLPWFCSQHYHKQDNISWPVQLYLRVLHLYKQKLSSEFSFFFKRLSYFPVGQVYLNNDTVWSDIVCAAKAVTDSNSNFVWLYAVPLNSGYITDKIETHYGQTF